MAKKNLKNLGNELSNALKGHVFKILRLTLQKKKRAKRGFHNVLTLAEVTNQAGGTRMVKL